MIDILPSRRSAIFTDSAPRKLSRSFYWGAGFAILLHAGLVYYLVQQNFTQAVTPETEAPPVTTTLYTPPKPPVTTQTQQKPVNHVLVHATPEPLTTTQTVPLKATDAPNTVADGPPTIVTTPPVTGGGDTKADPGPAYVTPHWTAFPDANALTNYYPPRALDNEMEGAASVQCTVLDAAGRVHCTVVSETPKGYGFGQQTVKMVEEKGRVDTSVGNIKVGSVLATTTVKWQLN